MADVLESSVAVVAVECVAARVAPVQFADTLRRLCVKIHLTGDSLAGRFPHAGDVDILVAVVVKVAPAAAHACANVFDVGLL